MIACASGRSAPEGAAFETVRVETLPAGVFSAATFGVGFDGCAFTDFPSKKASVITSRGRLILSNARMQVSGSIVNICGCEGKMCSRCCRLHPGWCGRRRYLDEGLLINLSVN